MEKKIEKLRERVYKLYERTGLDGSIRDSFIESIDAVVDESDISALTKLIRTLEKDAESYSKSTVKKVAEETSVESGLVGDIEEIVSLLLTFKEDEVSMGQEIEAAISHKLRKIEVVDYRISQVNIRKVNIKEVPRMYHATIFVKKLNDEDVLGFSFNSATLALSFSLNSMDNREDIRYYKPVPVLENPRKKYPELYYEIKEDLVRVISQLLNI